MRSKNVAWLNGDSLFAEQLEAQQNLMEQWVINTNNINYGIKNLVIDEGLLSGGIVKIHQLEVIFPQGQYINYNSKMYDLTFNLDQMKDQTLTGQYLYVECKNIFATNSSQTDALGQLISINYKEPKLSIKKEPCENSIPFLELQIIHGVFSPTLFLGPRIKVERLINNKLCAIFSQLESLLIFMKNQLLSIKDREYLNNSSEEYVDKILFIQCLFQSLGKLQVFLQNPGSPRELYIVLVEIIGILGWKHCGSFPIVSAFSANNWSKITVDLISLIYEIISGNTINHKSIPFTREFNYYVANMGAFNGEDPLLLIDPNREDVRHWIENANISSENFMETVQFRRISGVKREIIKSSRDLLIVKLDRSSEFIRENTRLFIEYSPNVSINSINISLSSENI